MQITGTKEFQEHVQSRELWKRLKFDILKNGIWTKENLSYTQKFYGSLKWEQIIQSQTEDQTQC